MPCLMWQASHLNVRCPRCLLKASCGLWLEFLAIGAAEKSGLLQERGRKWGRRGYMGASHAGAGPAAVPRQALHCCVRPRSGIKVS